VCRLLLSLIHVVMAVHKTRQLEEGGMV